MRKWLSMVLGLIAILMVTANYAAPNPPAPIPTMTGVSSPDGTSATLYTVPPSGSTCSTSFVSIVSQPTPISATYSSVNIVAPAGACPSSSINPSPNFSNLTPGTVYRVNVLARAPQSQPTPATVRFATAFNITSPTNISIPLASIKSKTAMVTWSPVAVPSGVNTSHPMQYKVAISPGGSQYTTTNTSQKLVNLTPNTSYTATVSSFYPLAANGLQAAAPVSFTTTSSPTLAAPTNVSVASVTSNSANISWESNNDVGTTYSIVMSPTTSQPLTGLTGTWKTLTGLTPGTNYSATVSAVTKTQTAAAKPVSLTTNLVAPTAVNAPSITVTSDSATLYWASGNGSNATYNITLSPTTSQPLTGLPFVAKPLTGLLPGTTYSATVSAVNTNASNNPQTSAAGSFTTALVTPTNVAVSNVDQTSATVSWAQNNNPSTTNYTINVIYSATGETAFSVSQGQASTSQRLTGLIPNTNYYVTVQAISGNLQTTAVRSAQFSTSTYVMTAPKSVAVSNITPTTAAVNWNAATSTNSGSVIQYTVTVNGTAYPVTTNTTQLLSNLQPNTNYSVTVSAAATGVNNSPQVAASVPFVTTKYVMTAPSQVAVNAQQTSATVSWIPAGWTGGANPNANITYTVAVTPSAGVTVSNPINNTANVTGLTAGSSYSVTVSASDSNANTGNSPQAAAAKSFTTP